MTLNEKLHENLSTHSGGIVKAKSKYPLHTSSGCNKQYLFPTQSKAIAKIYAFGQTVIFMISETSLFTSLTLQIVKILSDLWSEVNANNKGEK